MPSFHTLLLVIFTDSTATRRRLQHNDFRYIPIMAQGLIRAEKKIAREAVVVVDIYNGRRFVFVHLVWSYRLKPMNAMQWIGGVDLVAIIEQYKRNIIHQINQLLPVPLPEHEFTTERVESMIVSIRKQLERQPQHQRLQMPTHLVPGPLPFNGPFPVQPMMPVNVPVQTIYNTDAFSHVEPSSNMWSKEMLSRRNEDGIHQLYPSHSFVCSTCAWRFDQREKVCDGLHSALAIHIFL